MVILGLQPQTRGPLASPEDSVLAYLQAGSVSPQTGKIESLQDAFTGTVLDTSKWVTANTTAIQTVTQNDVLNMIVDGDLAAVNHVICRSFSNYVFSGSAAYCTIVQPLQTNSGVDFGFSETWFIIRDNATDCGLGFILSKDGNLYMRYWNQIAIDDNQNPTPASIVYNATTHKWLRLRCDSTAFYWETAPDSGSNTPGAWTIQASQTVAALTAYFTVGSISNLLNASKIEFRTGYWDNSMSNTDILGPAKFDGVNFSTVLAAPPATNTYNFAVVESAIPTDVTDATSAYPGVIAEAATVTEVEDASITPGSSIIAETATVTEAETATLTRVGAVAETATVTESESSLAVLNSTVAEAATVTEAETGGLALPVSVTEAATPTDAEDATTTRVGAVAETATPTDAETATTTRVGAVAETATVTESESSLATLNSAVAETTTVTEAETATTTRVGAVAETSSVTDSTNGTLGPPIYAVSVVESAPVSDAPLGKTTMTVALTDTATVTTTFAGTETRVGAVTETATVTSTTDRALAKIATLVEGFDGTTLNSAQWGTFVSGSGAIAVDEELRLAVNTGTATSEALIFSNKVYDLTGSQIVLKRARGPTISGTFGCHQQIRIELDSDFTSNIAMSAESEGFLYTLAFNSGGLVDSTQTVYSTTNHAWWRIRESGGNIFWDVAPITASNPPISGDWTNIQIMPLTTLSWGVEHVRPALQSMVESNQPGTPAEVRFDAINTLARVQASVSETASVTDAPSAKLTRPAAVGEFFTPLENYVGGTRQTGTIAETATPTESYLPGWGYFASITEAATPLDSYLPGFGYFRSVSESAPVTDDWLARYLWEKVDTVSVVGWAGVDTTETPGWSLLDTASVGSWTGIGTTQGSGWNGVDTGTSDPHWTNTTT